MEYDMEHKTKSYVRRAQKNYINKFDRIAVRLPRGSSDLIREKTGLSINNYVRQLIEKDLKENYGVELPAE